MAKKAARPKPDTPAEAPRRTARPRARTTTTRRKSDGNVASSMPAPTTLSGVESAEPTEEDIRVRAYHRYLERGGRHGNAFDDWVEAKKDLLRR